MLCSLLLLGGCFVAEPRQADGYVISFAKPTNDESQILIQNNCESGYQITKIEIGHGKDFNDKNPTLLKLTKAPLGLLEIPFTNLPSYVTIDSAGSMPLPPTLPFYVQTYVRDSETEDSYISSSIFFESTPQEGKAIILDYSSGSFKQIPIRSVDLPGGICSQR